MEDTWIDHLVIAARSLDEGEAYLLERLGVRPRGGGEHTAMGTHNRLLRLGLACYIEIISINPSAKRPPHRRWFELDTEKMHERLRHRPHLITWAVRTNRIEELSQGSTFPLGKVKPMSRGELRWRLTLTEDGSLPGGGLIPFLIQWNRADHPASIMPESGCFLARLCGFHPQPEAMMHALKSIGAEQLIELKQSEPGADPHLTAVIQTPGGPKIID